LLQIHGFTETGEPSVQYAPKNYYLTQLGRGAPVTFVDEEGPAWTFKADRCKVNFSFGSTAVGRLTQGYITDVARTMAGTKDVQFHSVQERDDDTGYVEVSTAMAKRLLAASLRDAGYPQADCGALDTCILDMPEATTIKEARLQAAQLDNWPSAGMVDFRGKVKLRFFDIREANAAATKLGLQIPLPRFQIAPLPGMMTDDQIKDFTSVAWHWDIGEVTHSTVDQAHITAATAPPKKRAQLMATGEGGRTFRHFVYVSALDQRAQTLLDAVAATRAADPHERAADSPDLLLRDPIVGTRRGARAADHTGHGESADRNRPRRAAPAMAEEPAPAASVRAPPGLHAPAAMPPPVGGDEDL